MTPFARAPARRSVFFRTLAAGAPQRDLGEILAPPRWLQNLGRSSWLVVGIALVTVATVGLLALTHRQVDDDSDGEMG